MQQKLAAILAIDVAGRPQPAAGEAGLALELGTIQCELVDPTISRFGGRIFALTPSRTLAEFAEAATAVGCGLEIQRGVAERNGELPAERRLQLRIGIDVGEVATLSGDLQGNAVTLARGLAGLAAGGGVAVSGRVARRIEGRKGVAEVSRRGVLALEGGARLEVVELRPLTRPKAQSPWTLRRRWTWIAAIAAVVLLAGSSVVLWRPVREWLIPMPGGTPAVGTPLRRGSGAPRPFPPAQECARAPARMSSSESLGVRAAGSTRRSSRAKVPASAARRKAAGKSAVRSTTSPWPP
jgi:class 3 adenylate cyclase